MHPFILNLLFFLIVITSLGLVYLFYGKIRQYLNRRIVVSTKVYDMQQELRETSEEKDTDKKSEDKITNAIITVNEYIQTPIRFLYGFFQ